MARLDAPWMPSVDAVLYRAGEHLGVGEFVVADDLGIVEDARPDRLAELRERLRLEEG